MYRFIQLLSAFLLSLQLAYAQAPVITGAARTAEYLPLLKNKRVALLVNQTATIDPL